MTSKVFQGLKFLLTANFCVSVVGLIIGSISSVPGNDAIFEFNPESYDPLLNNLRIMMIFLSLSEISICLYSFLKKKFQVIIMAGFFLILMTGSLEFYGQINDVPVDPDFPPFFLYVGLSHILFGVQANIEKTLANRRHEMPEQ